METTHKIIMLHPSAIKPYANNPRQNKEAVQYVKQSIQEFGYINPIILDREHVIIAGHTRWQAAKESGMTELPCIVADWLTPEQVRAYRLVDNRSTEVAQWDLDKLRNELTDIEFDWDGFDFDWAFDGAELFGADGQSGQGGIKPEDEPTPDYAAITQDKVENILNLGYGQYIGAGKYDIPILDPVFDLPEIDEWVGFNYALSTSDRARKGVHFYVDDYQFERVWNRPETYLDVLKQFAAVMTPDFSPYGDMPLATQIFNHYRKHWVGRYWQLNGLTVIPTIRASTDPRSADFYLDGEPEGGIVSISTMWATTSGEILRKEFDRMMTRLKPSKVLVYGKMLDWIADYGVETENIPTFTDRRWG